MGKGILSRKLIFFALLFVLVVVRTGLSEGAESFPAPRGAVNDFAGVISAPEAARMEALAGEVLEKTGTALVAVTVETIGDNDPNDYANRLYKAWGIGKKGEDKGVLLFLALKERRVRIETGYGVEGILPDGLTGEILDRYALPWFKKGDYGRGFLETTAALASVVAKDAGVTLTGVPRQEPRPVRTEKVPGIFQLLLLAAAVFFLLGTRQGRAMLPWLLLLLMSGDRRGGGGFGGFGGGGFGGFGGGSSGGGGSSRGF
ncbi:MAG: TPM domain-containing protein [Deltaproteobacteria bacterium]|nr:TPM domain-containing protein [Deltaproteobacteria bacterium]